jgi:hypothetical protein
LGDYYFFVKNTETATSIRLLFSTVKSYVLIFTKMDWATFWATFSQTHVVTLQGTQDAFGWSFDGRTALPVLK